MRRVLVALAAAAALAALASAAPAGPPGAWTRVTAPNGRNIDQISLARTADGVLHVAWVRRAGTKESLVHTAVAPSGALVGGATAIDAPWSALTNPALVRDPAGLRVLFAGIRSTSTSDPYSSGTVFSAVAASSGTGWKLDRGAVAAPSSAYASDQVGASLAGDGTPVFAWSGTPGLFVHAGLDPAVANRKLQSACCAYSAGAGTDGATGAVVVAWYSNASGAQGVVARRVVPSPGPEKYLPGSADAGRRSAVSPDQKVGVTGRIGAPGVYVAYGVGYPTWKAVNLFEYGSGRTLRLAAGQDLRHPSLAQGPAGRLWAIWADGDRIFATRSNTQATVFGAVVPVAPPRGTGTIWKLVGDGSLGALDLFASVSTPGSLAFWHTQVPPGLSLAAAPGPATSVAAKRTTVLTVTDAGTPVPAAKVTVAGTSLTTGASGRVVVDLPPGRHTASASKPGYTPASLGGISGS